MSPSHGFTDKNCIYKKKLFLRVLCSCKIDSGGSDFFVRVISDPYASLPSHFTPVKFKYFIL